MFNYIKSEIYRVCKSNLMWINILASIIIGIAGNVILYNLKKDIPLSLVICSSLILGNYIFVYMLIPLDIICIDDFKYKTFKNVLSNGLTKFKIYLCKIISVSILGIILYLFQMFVYILVAAIMFPIDNLITIEFISVCSIRIIACIPLFVSIATIGTLLAFICKKEMVFIVSYFMFFMQGKNLLYLLSIIIQLPIINETKEFFIGSNIQNICDFMVTNNICIISSGKEILFSSFIGIVYVIMFILLGKLFFRLNKYVA